MGTYRLEDFAETSINRDALKAAKEVCKNPGQGCNPLIVIGGRGSGKTHLIHGIALELCRRVDWEANTLRARAFRTEFLDAYARNRKEEFFLKFFDADALILDDLQELTDSPETLAALGCIGNSMLWQAKPIVLSSSWSPRNVQYFREVLTGFSPSAQAVTLGSRPWARVRPMPASREVRESLNYNVGTRAH